MNPPIVSETWAASYFQTLAVLLVFILGIKAILHEAAIPRDIRRIVNIRYKSKIYLMPAYILGALSLLYISVLHPSGEDNLSVFLAWIAFGSVAVAIISLIVIWHTMHRISDRKHVVELIAKKEMKTFDNTVQLYRKRLKEDSSIECTDAIQHLDSMMRKYSISTALTDEHLRYLGEMGEPGSEKSFVLDAIMQIAIHKQASPIYDGAKLSDSDGILRTITKIVSGKGGATGSNISKAVEILTQVHNGTKEYRITSDKECVQGVMLDIGLHVVYNNIAEAIGEIVNSHVLRTSQLMVIGREALHNRMYSIAVFILNIIEDNYLNSESKRSIDTNVGYYGMLAHFVSKRGAAEQRAIRSLNNIDSEEQIDSMIARVSQICYFNSDYDTVNALELLKNAIRSRRAAN